MGKKVPTPFISSTCAHKPIDAHRGAARGDAALSLLLFEAENTDTITNEDGRTEKTYRGGSRGAFEKVASYREGSVIALLNPRILRPFQVRFALSPFSFSFDLPSACSARAMRHTQRTTSSH